MSCSNRERKYAGLWPWLLARAGALPVLAAVCLATASSIVPGVGFAQALQENTTSAASAPLEEKPRAIPVATAVHIESSGKNVRLVFDLSTAVPVKAFVLADPKRVVVDLPEVDFEIDPQVGQPAELARRRAGARARSAVGRAPAALIVAYRFGLFAPGRSRIVIDLGGPARIAQATCERAAGQGSHLVIELAPTDEASFAAAARAARAAQAAAMPAPVPVTPRHAKDARPTIVLDPGHGGLDSGAVGGRGIVEKQIVLAFAKELAAKLRASGRYKVVMTRTSDVFVPLDERVQLARNANAALFISIHADILRGAGASVSGATVYTESDRASDAEAAQVAESENRADAIAGVDHQNHPSDVSDILLDLARRETRTYSNVFARTLVKYWRRTARLNKNPHRSAGFVVLKAPDIPSVLLELGYLSNRKDVADLRSPEWRAKAAKAVVRSIDSFFARRKPRAPTTKAKADTMAMEPTAVAGSHH